MSKQTIHNNHHHRPNSPNYPQQQPPIQPSTSTGMESLSYSLDSSSEQQQQQQQYQPDSPTGPYDIKRIHGMGGMTRDHHDNNNHATTTNGEYNSIYSEEMSRMSAYQQYQEESHHHQSSLPTVNEYNNNTAAANAESEFDATKTVHEMHQKLLHLLSHPELFTDALIWESKLERGLDPSRPDENDDDDDDVNNVNGGAAGEGGGIKSFENEFGGADEQKYDDDDDTEDDTEGEKGGGGKVNNNDNAQQQQQQQHQKLLPPPLPQQIFAPDAEVVLPQALTATQLFGMERITGIELEAAAGITGLSHLFLRWLALMPEGDHMNIINPPGLTVMRISGGRYRVTAAHRVVWRWMNKFSFSDAMFQSSSSPTTTTTTDAGSGKNEEGSSTTTTTTTTDDATDFDFGDLVTMTIIDVFETDIDGKLLSYCPTFDNRAVHKTQQTVERIKKSATQFKQRIEVVKKSPAGQSAQHVAEDLGKRGLSAAFKGFTLVKNRIESELQNRQYPKSAAVLNGNNNNDNVAVSTASSDAVGGEDIGDESSEK